MIALFRDVHFRSKQAFLKQTKVCLIVSTCVTAFQVLVYWLVAQFTKTNILEMLSPTTILYLWFGITLITLVGGILDPEKTGNDKWAKLQGLIAIVIAVMLGLVKYFFIGMEP